MSGRKTLLLILLLLGGIAAAALFLVRVWPPAWRLPGPWQGSGPEFAPVELPPDHRETLVLWDYPWPLWEPVVDTLAFTADDAQRLSYSAILDRALTDFRGLYPHIQVDVRMQSFADGPAAVAAALAAGTGPDVLAIWWEGALPTSALVPVTPFLTEADQAAYHPLAWALASMAMPTVADGAASPAAPAPRSTAMTSTVVGGDADSDPAQPGTVPWPRHRQVWAWPRWIAFHYWLLNTDAPGPWQAAQQRDWTVAEGGQWLAQMEPNGGQLFVPGPGGVALLGELLAGVEPSAATPSVGTKSPAAEGPAVDTGAPAAAALAEALTVLRSRMHNPDDFADIFAILGQGYFRLAGGLGPAMGAWPFLPAPGQPSGGASEEAADEPGGVASTAYRLVPPPTLLPAALPDGQPALGAPASAGPRPVVSLGGYVVPRPDADTPPEKIQAAMELARFLSQRLAVEPLDRFLALPAPLAAIAPWQQQSPLPAAITEQLVATAAGAASGIGTGTSTDSGAGAGAFRPYPPTAAPIAPGTPGATGLRDALGRFWLGTGGPTPVIAALWPPAKIEREGTPADPADGE